MKRPATPHESELPSVVLVQTHRRSCGFVSGAGAEEEEEEEDGGGEALLSWKAHAGWVGHVQFCGGGGGGGGAGGPSRLLLTASNDKTLVI